MVVVSFDTGAGEFDEGPLGLDWVLVECRVPLKPCQGREG